MTFPPAVHGGILSLIKDRLKRADAVVNVLEESGIRRIDTEQTWLAAAADFKFRYLPALGDAFALGTAVHVDGMLLVGADDYDDVTDIPITRFRTEPA